MPDDLEEKILRETDVQRSLESISGKLTNLVN